MAGRQVERMIERENVKVNRTTFGGENRLSNVFRAAYVCSHEGQTELSLAWPWS